MGDPILDDMRANLALGLAPLYQIADQYRQREADEKKRALELEKRNFDREMLSAEIAGRRSIVEAEAAGRLGLAKFEAGERASESKLKREHENAAAEDLREHQEFLNNEEWGRQQIVSEDAWRRQRDQQQFVVEQSREKLKQENLQKQDSEMINIGKDVGLSAALYYDEDGKFERERFAEDLTKEQINKIKYLTADANQKMFELMSLDTGERDKEDFPGMAKLRKLAIQQVAGNQVAFGIVKDALGDKVAFDYMRRLKEPLPPEGDGITLKTIQDAIIEKSRGLGTGDKYMKAHQLEVMFSEAMTDNAPTILDAEGKKLLQQSTERRTVLLGRILAADKEAANIRRNMRAGSLNAADEDLKLERMDSSQQPVTDYNATVAVLAADNRLESRDPGMSRYMSGETRGPDERVAPPPKPATADAGGAVSSDVPPAVSEADALSSNVLSAEARGNVISKGEIADNAGMEKREKVQVRVKMRDLARAIKRKIELLANPYVNVNETQAGGALGGMNPNPSLGNKTRKLSEQEIEKIKAEIFQMKSDLNRLGKSIE